MLQIYIYGKNRSGYIDLFPGSRLDLEIFTELFDEELTLGAYSLPGEAPFTDNNKKIFGFIEMLNTLPETEQTWWRCDVINDGIPEMLDAKFTLQNYDGSFGYETGKYSYDIKGNKGLFGTLIGTKTLQDLLLPAIGYPAFTTRVFATAVMKPGSGYNQYPYMRFAPVAIMNFFDTERPDYNDEFLAEDIVNNLVVYGAGPNDWEFGRPTSADPTIAAAAGTDEYINHRTIPFFTYKWVIQNLFKQFGYTVQGEWMQDPAWDDAMVYNNFAIEKYDTVLKTDLANEINPAKHLPKKPIGVFLRDLQMFFNVKLSFLAGRIVSIDYRTSSLKKNTAMEVTALAGHMFTGTITDYKEKGFTLDFAFDTADNYSGDRVKDIDPVKFVASINKFADFSTLVIGRPFEFNDVVYVAAENQFFVYANGAGIDAWEYYSEKLTPYVIGPGEYKYETGIAPMVTHIMYNIDTDKMENADRVACDMKGSYFNRRFTLVENDFGTRIFFIKNIIKSGNNVPASFVNNRDKNNLIRVPKSLAWDGADGLYEYCWKDWLNFLNNTRKVKTTLALNQKTYQDLKATTKIRINGTNYLTASILPSIPLKEPVEVDLYRI